MIPPIEAPLQEIVKRINDVCLKQKVAKKYVIEFKDQQVQTKAKTEKFDELLKQGLTEKEIEDNGGLVNGALRYGVHIYYKVINTNDKTEMILFHQSYLCKDYKEYIKSRYKVEMLNSLLFECILIGGLNMEADKRLEADKLKKKQEAENEIPTMVKNTEDIPVMVK